ncbi:hypothetical protein D3C85_843080 [compost metagenome]
MGPGSGRKRSARAARTGGVEEQGRAFRRQGQTRQGQQLTVRTRLDPEADRDRPLRKGFGRHRDSSSAVQRQALTDQATRVAPLAADAVQAVAGGVLRRAGAVEVPDQPVVGAEGPGGVLAGLGFLVAVVGVDGRGGARLQVRHVDPDQSLLLGGRPLLDVEGQRRAVVARHETQVRTVSLHVGEVEIAGVQADQDGGAGHLARHARRLGVQVDPGAIGVVRLPPARGGGRGRSPDQHGGGEAAEQPLLGHRQSHQNSPQMRKRTETRPASRPGMEIRGVPTSTAPLRYWKRRSRPPTPALIRRFSPF